MVTVEFEAVVKVERTHELVLQLLREGQGSSVSGAGLAARLNLSRTSVWKHIQKLKSLGYEIISHPKGGYTLKAFPDLLIPEEIVSRLETSWLGREYRHYGQIGSTNDEALVLAAQGAPHGTVVVAEEQTEGRGRLQRSWVSPAGRGVYFSVILSIPLPVQEAPQSTMVAALGLVKILSKGYGLRASIKWPNDVLVQGKKIAGILADMQSDQDHTRFVVVGIGINVNHNETDLAGPFRYPATSLALELGFPLQRTKLFVDLLHCLEREYDHFFKNGFGAMLSEFERASAILGKNLQIQSGKEAISGKALGFTPEGALRLVKVDGKEEIIWVGDVLRVEGYD